MNPADAGQNALIARLPRSERSALLSRCEPVLLVAGRVLSQAARPMRHVYFPVDAFVSLSVTIDGTRTLEVGLVGREGMLGSHLVLGASRAPWEARVQGPGAAWRIATPLFRTELSRSMPLQRLLRRYLQVLMAQLAGAAACVRFHEIGPRLARRLLMTADRAHGAEMHSTQALLAQLLGVRRVGITTAAAAMQRDGLIAYHRGDMVVSDRAGLEAAACACYGRDQRAYSDILG